MKCIVCGQEVNAPGYCGICGTWCAGENVTPEGSQSVNPGVAETGGNASMNNIGGYPLIGGMNGGGAGGTPVPQMPQTPPVLQDPRMPQTPPAPQVPPTPYVPQDNLNNQTGKKPVENMAVNSNRPNHSSNRPDRSGYEGRNEDNRPPQENKKKMPTGTIIKLAVGLGIIFAIVVVIILATKRETIDLNQYCTIKIKEGSYNGYGSATYEIDAEKLARDYPKMEFTSDYKEELESDRGISSTAKLKPAQELAKYMKGSLDVDKNLSNGDTVHFTWSIDQESIEKMFKIRITFSDVEYKVEGLADVGTFDPFEGVELEVSGIDPRGTAKIKIVNQQDYTPYCNYTLDKSENLKNGDQVTVSILGSMSEENFMSGCAKTLGKIPSRIEMTFNVEIGHYANSVDEISEDAFKAMDAQAISFGEAKGAEWDKSEEVYLGMTSIGYYFLKSKSSDTEGDHYNLLYLMYRLKASNISVYDSEFEYYYFVEYYDLIVNNDGSITNDSLYKPYIPSGKKNNGDVVTAGDFNYAGYATLDQFKTSMIDTKQDKYEITDAVADTDRANLIENVRLCKDMIGVDVVFNDHTYQLRKGDISYEAAMNICEADGGHLITITSEEEQRFAAKLAYNYKPWIGAYRSNDVWYWVTGEELEKDYFQNTEYGCAFMAGNGYWSTNYYKWFGIEGTQPAYICEWDYVKE